MKKSLQTIRILLPLFMACLWVVPQTFSAEDTYYLENEVKDVERQLAPVDAETKRAEKFLQDYNANVEALKNAYDQIVDLENRQRSLLQKNLIKSTIVLGMETYGKINLVMGIYQQSVKMIILSVGIELVSNQMQNSFSSPYATAVRGLSEDAQKLLPEIREIQKTLAMSQDEVRQAALAGGDDLGETGLIYRKFQMTLEAIEKAKKAIYGLRQKLDATKSSVEGALPQLKEMQERLQKRADELKERLGRAYREKEMEQTTALVQQAQAQAQVKVSPAAMRAKDEEERQAMIAERQSWLYSVVGKYRKQLNETAQKMGESFTITNPYSGSTFSPLQSGPHILAVIDYKTEDLAPMGPTWLRNEQKWYKSRVDENNQYIKKMEGFNDEYKRIEGDLKSEAIPILSELAGLGAGDNSGFSELLSGIIGSYISGGQFIEKFNKEIEIFKKCDPVFDAEYNRKISEAKSFIPGFETAATNAIEAASFLAKKANEAADAYEAYMSKRKFQKGTAIFDIQQEVKNIFADGKGTDEVRNYLMQKKNELTVLYKLFSPLQRLKMQRDNLYSDVVMNYVNTSQNGNLRVCLQEAPEAGLKDVQGWFEGQYFQFISSSKINDNIAFGEGHAQELFSVLDQINDFMQFLPRIEDADTQIREAYDSMDLNKAVNRHNEIMKDISQSGQILNPWVATERGIGQTASYKFISKETSQARIDANNRFIKKNEEDSKKAAEELAKKKEEDNKARIRAIPGQMAALYGYHIQNARLNTYSLDAFSGDVVLMTDELKNGTMEITGRLATLDKVATLLISEDGVSFKQLPANQDFIYSFVPLPNKLYRPIVRIKTSDFEQIDLTIFRTINGIVYQNVNFTELVAQSVKEIAEAYERKDIGAFSNLISRDYLGNKTFLEEGARFDFDMFTDIKLKIYINRIDKRSGIFVADTKWDKTQVPRTTGQQQKTTGTTTMMFVLEDGKMKIKNLRGNLIYATLSPEIAQASGLSSSVVDSIRTAHDNRNATQPGAGTTEDAGGITSSSSTETTTLAIKSGRIVHGQDGASKKGYDMSSDAEVNPGIGDFDFTWFNIEGKNGAVIQKMTATDFDTFAEAPASGYLTSEPGGGGYVAGDVYAFITSENYYGKMRVTNVAISGAFPDEIKTVTFDYAIRTQSGNRNIHTQ